MMDYILILESVALGFVGALARELTISRDLKKQWKKLIIGAIAGGLFKLTGLPNHINSFFAGYSGSSFLENIYKIRFKKQELYAETKIK